MTLSKRNLYALGAAMLAIAVAASYQAGNTFRRLESADSLTEYSGPVDLILYGCTHYRFTGTCYVDFRLLGGPRAGFRYYEDQANYEAVRSAVRKGQRFSVTYGSCSNLYCWPVEIKASGSTMVRREQSVAYAQGNLLLSASLGAIAIILSIAAFAAAIRRG